MAQSDSEDEAAIRRDFQQAVNMAPAELERWLATEDSASVGFHAEGEAESVGHHSGRRIVEIRRKKQADLTAADYAHMRKVIGYVHRHLAQGGPAENAESSRWRYSLMNWGHDPLKQAHPK
ncbi:DUF3140 domain-containing protein [Falsiroseomonas tokyonensis]|uniref:DUF3140 domain-containing protein n=1 Tax=Falsiroseomonas tokyonensis TaxID=430521 RepID=A0ABV7BQY3_9PROT|nr:DUF3140 domain-containing protein [Falsiroseomonas tokyonensis]MBU8536520.1 DUF3140 domain-containing protein [Falsiroseomonas tokyonensis]